MKIAVYSIAESLFEGEADALIAQTASGQITVLNEHIPLITPIVGPTLTVKRNGEESVSVALVRGVLEVRPQSEVVALVEDAVNSRNVTSNI